MLRRDDGTDDDAAMMAATTPEDDDGGGHHPPPHPTFSLSSSANNNRPQPPSSSSPAAGRSLLDYWLSPSPSPSPPSRIRDIGGIRWGLKGGEEVDRGTRATTRASPPPATDIGEDEEAAAVTTMTMAPSRPRPPMHHGDPNVESPPFVATTEGAATARAVDDRLFASKSEKEEGQRQHRHRAPKQSAATSLVSYLHRKSPLVQQQRQQRQHPQKSSSTWSLGGIRRDQVLPIPPAPPSRQQCTDEMDGNYDHGRDVYPRGHEQLDPSSA
jgi:hypothetical protein